MKLTPKKHAAVVIGITALIFCLDLALPVATGEWTLYLLPLLLWARRASPASTSAFTVLLIALTFTGLYLAAPGAPMLYVASSYGIGLVVFVTISIMMIRWGKTGAALRESEERYRMVVDGAAEGILVADIETRRFTQANPAICRMLGYTHDELMRLGVSDIHPQPELPRVGAEFEALARGEKTLVGEVPCLRKDGTIFPVEIKGGPALIDGRRCSVGFFTDITERKRAEQSVRLLSSVIEQTTSSIMITEAAADPMDSKIIFVNAAFTRMRGYAVDEVLGKTPAGLLGPRADRALMDRARQSLARGEVFRAESIGYRKDGTELEVEWVISPIRDAAGAITHFVANHRDITARKRAEEGLRAERDLLTTLMDSVPDHIFFKDAEGRLLRTNRAHAEALGLREVSEAVGKTDFDLFPREFAERFHAEEQAVLKTGQPIINRLSQTPNANGELRWLSETKVAVRDAAGRAVGLVGISRDVTDQKRAQDELAVLQRQLIDASREAGMAEIATNILHNVGNVLNSVNISCSLVLEQVQHSRMPNLAKAVALLETHRDDLAGFLGADPKGRQLPGYLSALAAHLGKEQAEILREIESLRDHIDHIKEIVAMQQSYAKVSGMTEPLAIQDLIEDALRINAAGMERHDVRVIREYAETPPVLVERHRVLQILVNLLHNAKYALDEGSAPERRLVLRTEAIGNERVKVSVTDNGVGIAHENLIRVFEFGFTTRKEGHGFGLHYGALAAQELGGVLAVQSNGPGQGATFTLELPCQPRQKSP
ncbi:MAG: PAS domain S-box protein [Limisphaerales bacterium]